MSPAVEPARKTQVEGEGASGECQGGGGCLEDAPRAGGWG